MRHPPPTPTYNNLAIKIHHFASLSPHHPTQISIFGNRNCYIQASILALAERSICPGFVTDHSQRLCVEMKPLTERLPNNTRARA